METINFGKRTQLIILLILIAVIFIIIVSWRNSKHSNPDEDKPTNLLKRLRELADEIEEEMRTLKLTKELKVFVEKRISYLFKWAKVAFAMTFAVVVGIFYWQSHEIFSSLMNSVSLFIFMCCTGSFFLASRFAEANSIIKLVQERIRKRVYREQGYDPLEEKKLELRINEKKAEMNLIMIEIRQVKTSNLCGQN